MSSQEIVLIRCARCGVIGPKQGSAEINISITFFGDPEIGQYNHVSMMREWHDEKPIICPKCTEALIMGVARFAMPLHSSPKPITSAEGTSWWAGLLRLLRLVPKAQERASIVHSARDISKEAEEV